MSLLSPSSAFYPLLWVNPANPLDSYNVSNAITSTEYRTGMNAGKILDVLPATMALLSLTCPVADAEVDHIESCLLAPFRSEHKRKMWYIMQDIAYTPTDDEREEDEEDYDW